MLFKKFSKVYVNGCSHTAGHRLMNKEVIDLYVEKYGVDRWENERDVNYPKRLKNYFKIDLIDDSECGSGSPRLIRRTYEYINRIGINEAKKTLFIFSLNAPSHRLEYYCKKIDDYLIVNVQYNDDGSFNYINVVDKFSLTDRKYNISFFQGEILEDVKTWLTKYHDPIIYMNKIHDENVGLFSFLELHNLEYFFGFDAGVPNRPFNENRKINVDNCQTIYEFVNKNNMTLHHELDENSEDFHPGYFGHLEYSKQLSNFLNNKLN